MRSQDLAICLRARAADASERAHNSGSPIRAPQTARPVAIAPLPAIPSCSSTRLSPLIDWSIGTVLATRRPTYANREADASMSGQQGREVVIVEAVRTPIGRGHPE